MQILPDQAITPLHRFFASLPVGDVAICPGDLVIRGHHLQDLRSGQGALRVQIAPPVDGLDPPGGAEAPMVPQHASQLGVHAALYPVVRCRQRPEHAREARVDVGEERPLPDEGRKRASRPDEPLVGVGQTATLVTGALGQERTPARAP